MWVVRFFIFHQPGNKQHVLSCSLVYPSDPPSNRESEVRSGCYNSARITQFCREQCVLNRNSAKKQERYGLNVQSLSVSVLGHNFLSDMYFDSTAVRLFLQFANVYSLRFVLKTFLFRFFLLAKWPPLRTTSPHAGCSPGLLSLDRVPDNEKDAAFHSVPPI